MSRPQKCRYVSGLPQVMFFKPAGIPMARLREVSLTLDELEALRHAHIENLRHSEAARQMGVSRPTFTRILAKAHRKVAEALVHGKALRINGGNYEITNTIGQKDFTCGTGKETEKQKNAT